MFGSLRARIIRPSRVALLKLGTAFTIRVCRRFLIVFGAIRILGAVVGTPQTPTIVPVAAREIVAHTNAEPMLAALDAFPFCLSCLCGFFPLKFFCLSKLILGNTQLILVTLSLIFGNA